MTSKRQLLQEIEALRLRLDEAEETLRAIRAGDVDAIMIGGKLYSLAGAETPYRRLVEAMNEGAATMTEDGTILYANQRLAELMGAPLEELLGSSIQSLVDPAGRAVLSNLLNDARKGRGTAEIDLCRRDFTAVPVQISLRVLSEEPAPNFSAVVTDLRKRKRVETELQRLNRALRTISSGNQSLVRAKTESELLDAICRAAVDEGGFRMVWIGYAENDEHKTVRVMAHAGIGSEYLANAHITWAESAHGLGPTGRCIRTRAPATSRDIVSDPAFAPWRENARQHGYASSLSLPLVDGDAVIGAINFYATEPHVFDEAEITILKEMADDLTFGIVTLRMREARVRAEERLQLSERRFKAVFEQAAVGMMIVEGPTGRLVHVNQRFCDMLGYTSAELAGLSSNDLTSPDDVAADTAAIEQIQSRTIREFVREKRFRRKDGTYFWAKAFIAPLDPTETKPALRIGVIEDIDVRKRAEASLRESEEHYRSLFENMLNGYAYCRMIFENGRPEDFVYISVNHAFETLTGLKNVTGRRVSEVIPGIREHDRDLLDIYGRVATTGVPARIERHVKSIDMWFSLSVYSPQKDHFVATFDVITERKRAELKLRQSEERYRLLFEGAHDGIFSIAATGAIMALNPAFERITGWPPAQWLGRPFDEIIYPEDRGRAADLFGTALRGEPTPATELRVRTAAGGFRLIEFTGFSSQLTQASAELQGIGRDITERREYERRLQEKVEIINNAYEGVVIVNEEDRISLWNRGAERIFGYSADEAVGRTPDEILGAKLAAVETPEESVERTGYWQGEIRCQARDGRALIVECRVTQLRDEAGHPAGRLGFLSDVTEKKLLEEKFLHAQRLESLGMLAAGIAHDLNNTLAPVMFAAPMLRDRLSDPADLKLVDTLARSAERGANLVKQILDFSRTTSGEFMPTDVKHVARDVASVIEGTFPKSIHFEHHVASDLWPVLGNATQIHQVLLNLCVNARDAMPLGGKLRMTVENRRLDAAAAGEIAGPQPGAWLFVEISDTGTGIAPELLESIWTPFFTTKGPGKGTGLGLSTVRAIIDNHHGLIALRTAVGIGSTFQIYLPALEAKPVGPSSKSPFPTARGEGQDILVVDDDASIRDIMTALLRQAGYHVTSCGNGAEAIAYFSDHRDDIQLLITDVDMPRMGGVDLAQRVLELRPGIRILAMSGLSRQGADQAALPEIKKFAHAFLLKPFKGPHLLATVHRLLSTPAEQ